MAYTPTIWNENDIITAEKLNNIENGIGNLVLDLGEVEVSKETGDPYLSASIYFTENQVQKISNENLIGVLIALKYNNSVAKCFLNKAYSSSSVSTLFTYFYSDINTEILGVNLKALLLYTHEQQRGIIFLEENDINNIPIIASFESEEEINGATGSVEYSNYTGDCIKIKLPATYIGPGQTSDNIYASYTLYKIKTDYGVKGYDNVFGTSILYQEEDKTYLKTITCECYNSAYKMIYKTQEIISST